MQPGETISIELDAETGAARTVLLEDVSEVDRWVRLRHIVPGANVLDHRVESRDDNVRQPGKQGHTTVCP
jgi:hypothetical protein